MYRVPAKFWALPRRRKRLLCEAAVGLAYVKLLLAVLPLRRLLPRAVDDRQMQPRVLSPDDPALRRDIHWAIVVASRVMPFRADCLLRSVAQSLMQRRRGLHGILYIGVRQDAGADFKAHAWIARDSDTEAAARRVGWRIIARYPFCGPPA